MEVASVVIAAVDDTAGSIRTARVEVAGIRVMGFEREEAVEPLDSIGPVLEVLIATMRVDCAHRAWRRQ